MALEPQEATLKVLYAKFTGGVGQASEILDWIMANGGSGRYLPAVSEHYDEASGVGQNAQPEYVLVNTQTGSELVGVGDYVVFVYGAGFIAEDGDTFLREFEVYVP